MQDIVIAGAELPTFLSQAVGLGGAFAGAKIRLVSDTNPARPTTPLSGLTTCVYTGYADSAPVTWGTVHLDNQGRALVMANPVEFKATGGATPDTARQVVLMDAAGVNILASYFLDTPLVFSSDQSVYLIGFPLYLNQPSGFLPDILP